MSLKTWKEEFYPFEAYLFTEKSSGLEAAKHSLQKWIGMRKENLERHGGYRKTYGDLGFREKDIVRSFQIYNESCSLCQKFLRPHGGEPWCKACPLAIARGGVPCDKKNALLGETVSPWFSWTALADPEPMIHWLGKAVDYQGEQSRA